MSSAIPRRIAFADPRRSGLALSHDGRMVAWLDSEPGEYSVLVAETADTGSARRVVRAQAGETMSPPLIWAPTGSHLVFFRDHHGDENYRAIAADLATGALRSLTPGSGVRALFQRSSPAQPSDLLFATNARDRRSFDLLRINVRTGRARTVFANPGFSRLHAGVDFEPRLAEQVRADGAVEVLELWPNGDWRHFAEIPVEDALTTHFERVSADGQAVFLIDSRGRDRAALVQIDFESRAETVLATDPEADIDTVVFDPNTDRPLAASATAARRRWHPIDPGFVDILDRLLRHAGSAADVAIEDAASGGATVLARTERDNAASEYHIIKRSPALPYLLFQSREDLNQFRLQSMRPVTVRARDGLAMTGYVTLAPGRKPPTPLVLAVHGGPYDRDRWGLSPLHQWLASRGYAVLSVNFRGSTGFGKSHVTAADREWGGRMQDDLIDSVDWAVEGGIADPARVGIYGTSYGGYASLMAAGRDPEQFACFVDISGPSDLISFMASIPAYWSSWFATIRHRLADPGDPAGRSWLDGRSPMTHVGRMSRPLLVVQGLQDVRVRPSESRRVAAALASRRIPVTLATLPNEGHYIQRPEARIAVAALVELFLSHHLGGEAEPTGRELSRSHVHIEVGGEFLPPEVREALFQSLPAPPPPDPGTPTRQM